MTQDGINTLKLFVLTGAVWGAVWLGVNNQSQNVVSARSSQAKAEVKSDVEKDKLVWLDNYDAAIAEAKRTGKPIFLEFRCAP